MLHRVRVLLIALVSAPAFCQLPSSQCDSIHLPLRECSLMASNDDGSPSVQTDSSKDLASLSAQQTSSNQFSSDASASAFISSPDQSRPEHFHWGRALFESFMFLGIEQGYVVHEDWRWVTAENGVPFNHYWRDYKQSLHSWLESGWSDGDPNLYGYLGHPIQGAMTSYIQIQNDPKGRDLELSNTKAYWKSRLKATLWNTVYSTQWNIGPLSEVTVEKYGAKVRSPWNQNGTWPCTSRHCYNGVGQIDLVMTPIGGLGWVLGEDLLDKKIAERVEGVTSNRLLIDVTRCALNPIRGGANILHGKRPWYRASRDHNEMRLFGD